MYLGGFTDDLGCGQTPEADDGQQRRCNDRDASFLFLGVMGPIFLGCGKNSPHSFAAERFASVMDYQQCDAGHCLAVIRRHP